MQLLFLSENEDNKRLFMGNSWIEMKKELVGNRRFLGHQAVFNNLRNKVN